jgi:hypothetical protein
MARRFVTDACFEVANQALQLRGGYGYLSEFGIEKIVRDLRVPSKSSREPTRSCCSSLREALSDDQRNDPADNDLVELELLWMTGLVAEGANILFLIGLQRGGSTDTNLSFSCRGG